MNFFEHQDTARKSSGRLVGLFCLAVLSTIIAVYLLYAIALSFSEGLHVPVRWWWRPQLFGWCAGIISAVIAIASLSKMSALRAGGSVVAEMMGGRRIDPGTQDPGERRLLNVVEEMSIASGMPVPLVYVLDSEGINAFAAGWSVDDAAVAVTRGCLGLLNREELQGVIAHESATSCTAT